jgi:uncharacterized protein
MVIRADVELVTDDGERLDGETAVPDEVVAAAVLAHPHPLRGGSMHAGLIPALFEALPARGIATLRFDFRGVGRSTGGHGGGVAERADVEAALATLGGIVPGVPVWLVGWSFGAEVSLSVGAAHAGWIAVAPPLRILPPESLVAANDDRLALLLVPEHDQFNPPDAARATVADWSATTVEVVPATDHFLGGRMTWVADRVAEELTARAELA